MTTNDTQPIAPPTGSIYDSRLPPSDEAFLANMIRAHKLESVLQSLSFIARSFEHCSRIAKHEHEPLWHNAHLRLTALARDLRPL